MSIKLTIHLDTACEARLYDIAKQAGVPIEHAAEKMVEAEALRFYERIGGFDPGLEHEGK